LTPPFEKNTTKKTNIRADVAVTKRHDSKSVYIVREAKQPRISQTDLFSEFWMSAKNLVGRPQLGMCNSVGRVIPS
jgi:hypothetical protein